MDIIFNPADISRGIEKTPVSVQPKEILEDVLDFVVSSWFISIDLKLLPSAVEHV